jgi:hypothetical protein
MNQVQRLLFDWQITEVLIGGHDNEKRCKGIEVKGRRSIFVTGT